jgi:hypothetical protein
MTCGFVNTVGASLYNGNRGAEAALDRPPYTVFDAWFHWMD